MDPKTLTNSGSFVEVCVRPLTAAVTWFLCVYSWKLLVMKQFLQRLSQSFEDLEDLQ